MFPDILFFDLDDTLYDSRCGLWRSIRERMGLYMAERLGFPAESIPELRRLYYETYGTTLRGLQRHHQVDADDFLAYVHDLPIVEYIQPNPALRELLLGLKQPRWIFTNADANHAQRVLAALGVEDCFQGIIDIRAVAFACKPEVEAYRRALDCAGGLDPRRCIFFDDSISNLEAAQRLGFTTVWIRPGDETHPAADYALADLLDLPRVMPGLWNGGAG